MTVWSWVMVATLVATILLVGLGFATFWPKFPPIDDTPMPRWATEDTGSRHRVAKRTTRRERRRQRAALLDGELREGTRGYELPPPAEDLAPPEEAPDTRRPMHRFEHVGQETTALEWPLPRDEGPPEWPPRAPQ